MHVDHEHLGVPNTGVCNVSSARLQLRGDLVFSTQSQGGESFFLVEDPLTSKFVRLGRMEFAFAKRLNGARSIAEALQDLSTESPHHGLSEFQAIQLSKWLLDMQLARVVSASQAESAPATPLAAQTAKWNPLFFRFSLGNPEKVVAAIAPFAQWIFTGPALVIWAAAVFYASFLVASDWDEFQRAGQGVFATSNWGWLLGAGLALKLVHELGHAIACKRFGGVVREAGCVFILFAPLAFVDVTSAWRFRRRWPRIVVDLAGMYVELFCAALAIFVWRGAGNGWVGHFCYNVAIAASLHSLLFNANPLMKFDGYFVLSDLLNIPNLYTQGQQFVRAMGIRLLGGSAPLNAASATQRWVVAWYGVLSFGWRMFVCCGLLLAATALFDGGGLVLALIAGASWAAPTLLGAWKSFRTGTLADGAARVRLAAIAGVALTGTLGLYYGIPWPGRCVAPAIIEYPHNSLVRVEANGFVRRLHVAPGDEVQVGQLIAELENPELDAEVRKLELEIKQIETSIHHLEQVDSPGEMREEEERLQGAVERLHEAQERRVGLTVRAPRNGRVVRRDLLSLQGVYLQKGDALLTIGEEDRKRIVASIRQEDVTSFARQVEQRVEVRLNDGSSVQATLEEINPRATVIPPHEALTAENGGPLAVRFQKQESQPGRLELLDPRFTATLQLSTDTSAQLLAGQRGELALRPFDEKLGPHIHRVIRNWIRAKLHGGDRG